MFFNIPLHFVHGILFRGYFIFTEKNLFAFVLFVTISNTLKLLITM